MWPAIARIGTTRKKGGESPPNATSSTGRPGGRWLQRWWSPRGSSSWTRVRKTHTSHWHRSRGTRPGASDCAFRCPSQERGKNTTVLSSMTLSGMGPSLAVEGPTTARVFETYVEEVLVPSLHTPQIVVMDNLGAHRPKRIGQLIERQGCELLYLPAYSPDYKWDEKAEIMLRREPTMVSLENRSRSQADPQEGGLRPCPSTTHPSTTH